MKFEENLQWNWCAGTDRGEPAGFTFNDEDMVNSSAWTMGGELAGVLGSQPPAAIRSGSDHSQTSSSGAMGAALDTPVSPGMVTVGGTTRQME